VSALATKSDEYVERIRQHKTHAALRKLWEKIRQGEAIPQWPPGKALEYLVLRAFEVEKAEVDWPLSNYLEGEEVEQLDGVVHSDGLSFVVEAKDQGEGVNIEPIAKLSTQLQRRPLATMGLVVSRTGFTSPARLLMRYLSPVRVLLWDGEELTSALKEKAMRQVLLWKHRAAVQRGVPDANLFEEGKSWESM
jgi:hypothetical protein